MKALFQTQYHGFRYECFLISMKMDVCFIASYSPCYFPLDYKREGAGMAFLSPIQKLSL